MLYAAVVFIFPAIPGGGGRETAALSFEILPMIQEEKSGQRFLRPLRPLRSLRSRISVRPGGGGGPTHAPPSVRPQPPPGRLSSLRYQWDQFPFFKEDKAKIPKSKNISEILPESTKIGIDRLHPDPKTNFKGFGRIFGV